MIDTSIAIYVHWPFCKSKCPYCDFNSHVTKEAIDSITWLERYKEEIDIWNKYIRSKYVRSIFFGGGTPSLMEPEIIQGIIDHIGKIGTIDAFTEITCEVNPTSFEAKKFASFKAAGINRVSVGVQSFDESQLKFLGRNHTAVEARKALEQVANQFDNYSFDLIYALPGQTIEAWSQDLQLALQMKPQHISLYQLTIESGTKFAAQYKAKRFVLPPNDLANDMYEHTNAFLQRNGYRHYEISNYGLPGKESMHNMGYWNYQPYIGIGPGAHGRLHDESHDAVISVMATSVIKDPKAWLAASGTQALQAINCEPLSTVDIVREICLMSLRLDTGLNLKYLHTLTGVNLLDVQSEHIARWVEQHGKYFELLRDSWSNITRNNLYETADDLLPLRIRIKRQYIHVTDYLIGKLLDMLL